MVGLNGELRLDVKPRIPLVICIDLEPDEREMAPAEADEWRGLPVTCAFFQEMRSSMTRATGSPAHLSWFLRIDEQIERVYGSAGWAAGRYRDILDAMGRAGDEIGLHVHAWRWDELSSWWSSEFADDRWIERVLRQSFQEFRDRFGRPCESFRFGDRWMNNAALDLVDRLGASYDLTIEPGRRGDNLASRSHGSGSDFSGAPRHCYYPSRGNFLVPGDRSSARRLCEMPISTVALSGAFGPQPGSKSVREAPGADSAFEGYLDSADRDWLSGWVYDATRPDDVVSVDVYVDGTSVGAARADLVRPDLAAALKGNGAHAFRVRVPGAPVAVGTRLIAVKVSSTGVELANSPQTIGPAPGRADDFWTMNLFNDSVLFGRAFDSLLTEPELSHVALVIRSDALLEAGARRHVERNLEYVLAHPEATRFVFATPDEAKNLLSPTTQASGER